MADNKEEIKKEKEPESEDIENINSEEDELVTREEFEQLKKWYSEELERKDKKIEELEKERAIVLGSALKRSQEFVNMAEKVQQLNKNTLKTKKGG